MRESSQRLVSIVQPFLPVKPDIIFAKLQSFHIALGSARGVMPSIMAEVERLCLVRHYLPQLISYLILNEQLSSI